jgi:hypothetical protein
MDWENIIGIDTNSPYDCLRMKNLAPHGNFSGIDHSSFQFMENRPTPELANHRTPVKNLYCTGGCWHVGGEASANQSYNCYKIIATDMGLGKPWEEGSQHAKKGAGVIQAKPLVFMKIACYMYSSSNRYRLQSITKSKEQ